jgi:hypothetical protein
MVQGKSTCLVNNTGEHSVDRLRPGSLWLQTHPAHQQRDQQLPQEGAQIAHAAATAPATRNNSSSNAKACAAKTHKAKKQGKKARDTPLSTPVVPTSAQPASAASHLRKGHPLHRCLAILEELLQHPDAPPFSEPVRTQCHLVVKGASGCAGTALSQEAPREHSYREGEIMQFSPA